VISAARSLVVYHTSDVHARLGFGALVARTAEPGSLLVDCGDSLRGSSTLFFRDEPVTSEFAAAPYRAQAVGNREFHYVHRWFLSRARMQPMPMICSNLVDLRSRAAPFSRELHVDVDGVRVRLLAALTPQYRTGSGWERIFGWRFLAPAEALAEMLAQGRARSTPTPDATILLSHLGLDADRKIAQAFPHLSAIVGGHSHETLAQPEIVGGVPIAHAGPFAQYLGRLELRVAPASSKAQFISFRLLPLLAKNGA